MIKVLMLILCFQIGKGQEATYLDTPFPEVQEFSNREKRIDDGSNEWLAMARKFSEIEVKSEMHALIRVYFMTKINDRKSTFNQSDFIKVYLQGADAKFKIIESTIKDRPDVAAKHINLGVEYIPKIEKSLGILGMHFKEYRAFIEKSDWEGLEKWEKKVKNDAIVAVEKSEEAIAAVWMFSEFLPARIMKKNMD